MSKQVYNGFKWIAISIFSLLVIGNLSAQDSSQDSSDEYFTLARAEGSKGNFAKAASYCEKGLKKSPLDMDIKEYLGKCYMELGQLEKARTTLLDVLKQSPRRVDARHYLINIETQSKRYYSAVCYANELLEITPYSKALWLKKISLYHLMDNRVEANRSAKRLYQIFPDDIEVKDMYNNILKDDAVRLAKGKNLESAVDQYEKILDFSATDTEAYLNLINAYIKLGNYSAALSVADRGLQTLPNSNPIFDKKIGLLDETNEYQRAITLTEEKLKRGESAHYRTLLNYLVEKAARHYKNADPYVLYKRIYDQSPSNAEAFNFILNTSITRGYYEEAEALLKKALKSNPNSKDLLSKQLYVYEAQKNWEKIGNTVEKLYTLYPNDSDIKEKYNTWVFQKAKLDFNEQNYKESLWGFLKVSETPEYKRYANQYIFSIHVAQKSYNDALKLINSMISRYPNESQYTLNKIDLFMTMEDYAAAYEMAKDFKTKNPQSLEYVHMANTASLSYIRYLNKVEDFEKVKMVTDELIAADPLNMEAYQYGIGARVAMKQYDEALAYIQKSLQFYPKSKEIQLKLAGVYAAAGNHEEATGVLKALHQEYPYNDSLRNNLVEEMLLYAKTTDEKGEFEKSKSIYNQVRTISPQDTLAPIKLTNILIEENALVRSMEIIDSALIYHKDYPDLLYQKGLIYEKMGNFRLAREYHSRYMNPMTKSQQNQERLDYLDGKQLKNQVNLSYLNVNTDSTLLNTSIATAEYLRQINKNNAVIARVNYAARKTGVGVQGELDWYHTFKSKSSFIASAGVANQYFPEFKASVSYFQPLAKTWQAEIGGRYARLRDDRNFFTGIVGLEKTFDKVWLNAKVFLMSDGTDYYHNLLAQSKFYMRNDRNYIVAMASLGTAPEDQRLDFQINTFTSYVNTMVGAGYFHYINSRTSIGAQGNWYNFKMTKTNYINQYNVFLTVRTKF
ncbi:tetratricopeptide repeat protein [Pedobacter sp. ASV28]|uniref:tetratricopeptide repeat protein n=1 Tax=Pedobacter sp. ASV28 TaxID=2795123 RepID=UPI0018EC9E21|nr:tetratricopeptide repeat protein [Pedobacter sp. ASV28]